MSSDSNELAASLQEEILQRWKQFSTVIASIYLKQRLSATSAAFIDNRDLEPVVRIEINLDGMFSLILNDATESNKTNRACQFRPFGILEPLCAKAARYDIIKALPLIYAEDEAGTLINGDDRHTVYVLWVSSCEDPSLLYSCRIDSTIDKVALRYGQRTPSILKNMIEGANMPPDDPRFTMINLIGEQEMGLFIRLCIVPGDGPSALRLALRTPSAAEWKSHLLLFIHNLQNDLCKERWQRELLEKDALIMKSQIAQMERKRGWLEKELEMLYAVMQQQSPMQPLKITSETENSVFKREESLLQPASTTQITDSEKSPKFNIIAVSPKRSPLSSSPSSSIPSKSGSNFKKKRTNRNKDALAKDDLLIGVASLLSCAVCPGEVTLRDQDGIKEHFINQHLDGEHGRCRACTEEVKSSDVLSHMKAHLVKEYACEFCGKKGRKHYLKAHIRIHTGERPYKCEQCSRRFADSSTYRRHQMIHTGEKRYSCPVCGRCIARKDNVKTHLRSHVKTISNSESEAAAWMETLLNSLPTKTERNAIAIPPLDSPTSVENNEDQNLLGDFNLLESLKENDEMSDKS
ncbi:Gastrula zinc finger protein [Dirofilaria immitis]